ncbi:MAG: hypothetical protein J6A79_07510 [Clostridia bacterium]|nr:hypothetical protein [Clostridia bacterium]
MARAVYAVCELTAGRKRITKELIGKNTGEDQVLYTKADLVSAQETARHSMMRCLVLGVPFLLAAIAGFVMRNRLLCSAGAFCLCAFFIFSFDLFAMPYVRYQRWLAQTMQNKTHETAGKLLRISEDPVDEMGVRFREVWINIYADLSEEGERRFLLDWSKGIPDALRNQIVVIESYEQFITGIRLRGAPQETEA